MSTAPHLQLNPSFAPEEIGAMPSTYPSSELNALIDRATETPLALVIGGGILGYILLRTGLHLFYYIVAH